MLNNLIFLSTKKSLSISFIGMLICLIFFWLLEKKLGTQILDVLPDYDMNLIQKNFLIYGENGRTLYAWSSLTLDLLFPICYVTFFAGLIMVLSESKVFRWLVFLPCLLGTIDLIENVQIFYMLTQYPEISLIQVQSASNTTFLKHSVTIALYLSILCLFAFKVGKKMINR